jgi:hypothetical protein
MKSKGVAAGAEGREHTEVKVEKAALARTNIPSLEEIRQRLGNNRWVGLPRQARRSSATSAACAVRISMVIGSRTKNTRQQGAA